MKVPNSDGEWAASPYKATHAVLKASLFGCRNTGKCVDGCQGVVSRIGLIATMVGWRGLRRGTLSAVELVAGRVRRFDRR